MDTVASEVEEEEPEAQTAAVNGEEDRPSGTRRGQSYAENLTAAAIALCFTLRARRFYNDGTLHRGLERVRKGLERVRKGQD